MTFGVSDRLKVKAPTSESGLSGLVKEEAELARLCRRAWEPVCPLAVVAMVLADEAPAVWVLSTVNRGRWAERESLQWHAASPNHGA